MILVHRFHRPTVNPRVCYPFYVHLYLTSPLSAPSTHTKRSQKWNSSQSLSEPATATKLAPNCGYPGCHSPVPLKCFTCKETKYCSKKHHTEHWKLHKNLASLSQRKRQRSYLPQLPFRSRVLTKKRRTTKIRVLSAPTTSLTQS